MICFCAERFQWRRIWQNPGALLLPGLSDMATRALLYRRPAEPATVLVKHGSQYFAIRLRRHRRARRYTLRIHPTDREAILTMPPRGTLVEAKEFARLHGGWIAARLGRLPKAAPFHAGTVVPLRGVPHRIVHRAGERGTVWTETRDSGEKVRQAADKGGREWPYLQVRGSRVRPDSAISAASEIARRKNKSFAQYTGADRRTDPIGWAWNKKFWLEPACGTTLKD